MGVSIGWASAVLWFQVVIVCIDCFEVVGVVEQDWFGGVVPLGILLIINYYQKYVSINYYQWSSAEVLLWLRVEIAVVDIIGL